MLHATQKVVDVVCLHYLRILQFSNALSVKKAKMTKYHGSSFENKECFIPGQTFHMDLSFVRGPSNLKEMITSYAAPKKSIKESCESYIGFLTITDAATRYLWVHPINHKAPPLDHFKRFLDRHGIKNSEPGKAIITTDPDGYLDSSKAFAAEAQAHRFQVKSKVLDVLYDDLDDVYDLDPNHVCAKIRTDGGTEFMNSSFEQTVQQHGHDHKTTAADVSSQNRLVERPHRTLKERMRCLLYSACLGTEFWVDALLHVVWLYN